MGVVLQRERARRGQTGILRWALPIDGTRPRHYRIPRSGLVQMDLLKFDEKWRGERLSRSAAGKTSGGEPGAEHELPQPLSKAELRAMLLKNREPKETK